MTKTEHPVDNFGTIVAAENPGGHVFITASSSDCNPSRGAVALFEAILDLLRDKGAVPVHERIFASPSVAADVLAARSRARSNFASTAKTPFSFIHGAPPHSGGFAGVLLHAIRPGSVYSAPVPYIMDGRAIGSAWQSGNAEYMILQDMGRNADPAASPDLQTEKLLTDASRAISEAGFDFQHVVRTWFYLKDILAWYGDFNRVRSAAYQAFGLMPTSGKAVMLPASTGIEGKNANGTALTADLLLVRPKGSSPAPERLRNPAQKEAFQYGASFSRAVRIAEERETLIEVSGTAAIDEKGLSLYPGDAPSQIACTFDKIEALLHTAGADLRDIVSATVFVKHPEIEPLFRAESARRGLNDFPCAVVHADICRDELLFEIDAEALTEKD